jgi:hypothetical protein
MRRLLALTVALVCLLGATWQAVSAGTVSTTRVDRRGPIRSEPRGVGHRYVIGAAGDIACAQDPNGEEAPSTCQFDDTANLIAGTGLSEVLLLGDNQYEVGAYADYLAYFDPTWGRALPNLSPVPGNHEYAQDPSARPRGYFRYFGDRVKGPDGLGYYSYDLGACPDDPCWHLIALSSELCFASGGCDAAADPADPGPGERMYAWLQADLAANTDRGCTLAYWHHPRFSHSTGSGASSSVGPLWDLLYEAHADVVLNGHSHNYQRWRPQDPAGARDPDFGIREFIVGTGGRSHYAIAGGDRPENLVVAQSDAFGILRLTLKPAGYAWEWVSAAGQPAFEDAGHAKCV